MNQQLLPVSSETFIGREDDLQVLVRKLKAFNSAETNLLIIEGVAGIGKTTLINNLLEEMKGPHAFHLYGKFRDQEEKTPYLAIKQALKDWTNQILTLSEADYEHLKHTVLQALQFNAGVITLVFEELIPFFGKKYTQNINYTSAEVHQIQARFYYFFTKFLKAIHSCGYRVTLIIDDLQWADNATVALLKHLLKSNQSDLLIIAASRNSQTGENHELIKESSERAFTYHLKPLEGSFMGDFLPSEWTMTSEAKNTLLKYLQHQSGGNPFKLKQLIRLLEKERKNSQFKEFDPLILNQLPQMPLEKDAESMMKKLLQELTPDEKEVIGLATLIGFYFKPELLQKLYTGNLWPILHQLEQLELLIISGNSCIFKHDFIFKAATKLINPENRRSLHGQLAKIIFDSLPDYQLPDYFISVNHLNVSLENNCGSDPDVILYNLQAGNLAISNSAIDRAGKYFQQARIFYNRLSIENVTVKDPKIAAALGQKNFHTTQLGFIISFSEAQTAFLQKNYQQCINQLNDVLKLPVTRVQKVKAVNLKLMSCSAIMHMPNTRSILEDGIQSLISVLADFDIVIPSGEQELFMQIADFCRQIDQLESSWPDHDFPVNKDPEMYELQKLIINSLTFLYYMDVKKNLFLSLNTLYIILKTGLTPISPVFFSVSFLLGVVDVKYIGTGFRLGKRAIELVEAKPYDSCYHIVYYIATLNFYAWENHYNVCMERLQNAVQKAYEIGDHQYVSFCFNIIVLLHNYSGKNLLQQKELSNRLKKENSHTFFISTSNYVFVQFLLDEKPGFDKGKFTFPDDLISESKFNLSSRYHLHLNLSILYLLSGKYKEAEKAGAICEGLKNVYRGFQIELEHFFYYSIIVLELAFQHKMPWQKAMEIVTPKLQEFKRVANYGSGNYLHKVYLIEAGIEKNKENFEKATHLYDLAIAEAEKQQFMHVAAIATEIAANYYQGKGRQKISNMYLQQAINYYDRWGAKAKITQMKQQYPTLFNGKDISNPQLNEATNTFYKDLLGINQSYLQSDLPQLSFKLLLKLIKYSNSSHGFIFISTDKNWKVLAVSSKKLQHLLNQSIQNCREYLPEKVINYAIHQGISFSLNKLEENPLFAGDNYLQKIEPGTLHFFPVLNDNEKLALIYLEGSQLKNDQFFRLFAEQSIQILSNAINFQKLKLLNDELKKQEQIRISTAIASQEKERKRIAEELHDSLGQMLALIRLNFSQLEKEFNDKHSTSLFFNTTQMLDDSCQEVRTISHDLMPPDLNLPLPEMLEKLIRKNLEHLPVDYQYNTFSIEEDFSEAFKFTMYRVLQEIMHNIIKHSEASQLNITLTRIDKEINLMVEDNGKGFDKKIAVMGLGLKNINSRVKLLNGFFDVDSSLNRGTIYNITIPIDHHGKS